MDWWKDPANAGRIPMTTPSGALISQCVDCGKPLSDARKRTLWCPACNRACCDDCMVKHAFGHRVNLD
jgi:hypothetical protein